ncbi:MAG: phospholipase D-like domain-containing protein [Myxococcota bacterium]|nr:phospholipase D-like domain-containing protein [Myxococcota bacterium]
MRASALLLFVCTAACSTEESTADDPWTDGKGDGFGAERTIDVVLTEPYCDVCTADDKTFLTARSPITKRIIELLDGAQTKVDIANYTFSVRGIEDAVLRAKTRGVAVRVAMDKGQAMGDTVATRLLAAGVEVKFVAGGGSPAGLQHAKFMLVDDLTVATGSNNWSSTGTTINEESTIVIRSIDGDPILGGFTCHFKAIWNAKPQEAGACSNAEAAFSPSTQPIKMLKEELARATKSIDVLMHHLVFDDLVKELAKAAERGVKVRVIVNATDRAEHAGAAWTRLLAAGAQLRYKQTNGDLFQIMHHKLAVIDDRVVVNGSGNWSGSAFFKNFENYVRYRDPRIARPYRALYDRLWQWSLTGASLDAGKTAAQQHADETKVFFGNLHAHYAANATGAALDDGKAIRADANGVMQPIDVGNTPGDAARYAYEYARDDGGLDFLALTPHTTDDNGMLEAGDAANMLPDQFKQLSLIANDVTKNSSGTFVAIAGMEWSTNSTGNHVNIFGSRELAKVERGRFDLLFDDFLPGREQDGDMPVVQLNHPRTFRRNATDSLNGNWDQIFGVNLRDITNNSEREKKFNDFGLDDYAPLKDVLPKWVAGESLPDRAVVDATLTTIEKASRPYARLFEVLVGRGTEFAGENRTNPSITTNSMTGAIERFTRVHSDWDYYLLHGFRLAPTAPHDNHFANWGTGHSSRTGIIAPALTEASLLDAIDARAVFASEDEELELRLYADNRIPMGGKLVTRAATASLSVFLTDANYTGAFEVVVYSGTIGADALANGDAVREVKRQTLSGGAWQTITVDLPTAGERFFYLEVKEPSPDRMAWSAPIWIERL